MEKTIYELIYCVDDDTQDKIDEFDDLDASRDEQANRSFTIATFDSKEAAKEYLKQMKIAYDLMIKTEYDAVYNVYNPDACTILEINLLDLTEAKNSFKEDIKSLKEIEKEQE